MYRYKLTETIEHEQSPIETNIGLKLLWGEGEGEEEEEFRFFGIYIYIYVEKVENGIKVNCSQRGGVPVATLCPVPPFPHLLIFSNAGLPVTSSSLSYVTTFCWSLSPSISTSPPRPSSMSNDDTLEGDSNPSRAGGVYEDGDDMRLYTILSRVCLFHAKRLALRL